MIVKLLIEHHLEFLSLKGAAEARPSLRMSKCHIVGNLMHWLKCFIDVWFTEYMFGLKSYTSSTYSEQ